MNDITTDEHATRQHHDRRLLAAYAEHEDLLSIGAYRRGSNRTVDAAVEMRETIEASRQKTIQATPFDKLVEQLLAVASQCQSKLNAPAAAVGQAFQPDVTAQAKAIA